MNDGGPAFPGETDKDGNIFLFARRDESSNKPYCVIAHSGMTLRDWFAGQALAGYVSIPDDRKSKDLSERYTLDAAYCYALADAMLAARAPATPTTAHSSSPLGPVTND